MPLSWAAGLWEGEGSASYLRITVRRATPHPTCTLSSTDHDRILEFRQSIG